MPRSRNPGRSLRRYRYSRGSPSSSTGSGSCSSQSLLSSTKRLELYTQLMRLAGEMCEDPAVEQWAIGAVVDAAIDLAKGVGATGSALLDLWMEEKPETSGKRVVGNEV